MDWVSYVHSTIQQPELLELFLARFRKAAAASTANRGNGS
jgi:hypothetical protein